MAVQFRQVPSIFILVTLALQACGGGSGSSEQGGNSTTPAPLDTTAPIITLVGLASVEHEQGTTYVDAGASATDNVDGVTAVTTSGAIGQQAGIYTLTFTATDKAGNSASTTRTVTVSDTTAPTITLNGDTNINHEQGTEYTDAGASANDLVDGNVVITTSGQVESSAGNYTLTYTATDLAGNTTSTIRTVIVADTTAPVISIIGDTTINHPLGSEYVDAGATAIDTVDGAVSVTTSGTVGDVAQAYTLTYAATDNAGNQATAVRIINVGDSTASTQVNVFENGAVSTLWDRGINAFDSAIGWAECNNDGGAGCPSIAWQIVNDNERGNVLEVSHSASGDIAGLFISMSSVLNLSNHTDGKLVFDVKVVSGDSKITMKLDCIYPCTSGDQHLGSLGAAGWETVEISLASLANAGLNLSSVNTGIVIWATDTTNTIFQLDNIHFTGINDGGTSPGSYQITNYGAGSISDTINPESYRCVYDFGNWIYNAGIVEPAIASCDTTTGIPTGTPTKLHPQLTGPALTKPTPTHKWWGSVPFMGEMTIGDANTAAYITPDPMTARISERGVRVMGIPSGLTTTTDGFLYPIPDPFSEVFDGIAVGNSLHSNLQGYLKDHSDGSVTVEWQNNDTAVMEATFVHGSPYIYFKVYDGEIVIRSLRDDGSEKGTFYNQDNSLGIWTSVAGNSNNFLITGEGTTTFDNITSNEITINNATKEFTLTYLPSLNGVPSDTLTSFFAAKARNVVASVAIDYSVDKATNTVTVSHAYKNSQGATVETIAGMHPLHWKNSTQTTSAYQIKSARGTIKFSETAQFSYQLPFVGILPTLPSIDGTFDQITLETMITEFIAQGADSWNTHTDAYWSGKNYSKVAELIAIAESIGMTTEAATLRNWLKIELSDWFTAETDSSLDINKYFVYDEEWSTLLALEESFMSHQQLNDHHFHYGYLIRAAAEICRMDASWCSDEQYGPMIELLIRDYAGGRDDTMFPYLRNFDPANGFSWASGKVNFARGNNNESTSEAANAYGAIILYGLITANDDLVERGMYLHASTTAAYWEYWNNIDDYNAVGETENNFPDGYDKITTSIIWGDGAVFSTWFSAAYAHILGIQGLPINPLTLHVGLHADYMEDYVTLGLSESSNGKPSGLVDDQWRDIWWNLWAMTNADLAINDYESVASYEAEAGETKAHTYHWLHTFSKLGHLKTGTGALTANHPAALAFEKNGVTSYVVYNFSNQTLQVTFSDGKVVAATANGFTVVSD
jgi:endoglucanase Acf2